MPAITRTAAAVLAALALAGCANTVSGDAQSGSAVPPTTGGPSSPGVSSAAPSTHATSSAPTSNAPTSSTPSGGSSSGFPTTVDGLAILELKGANAIHSAHLELKETAASTAVHGIGDETLDQGKVSSIDLTETVGSTTIRLVAIGTKFYAKLPPELHHSTKPWVLITSSTSDPALLSLYQGFQQSVSAGAGEQVTTFVNAASSVQLVGTEQLDGVEVGHYKIGVSVSKLPTSYSGKSALEKSGLSTIPVELYIDAQGRPRKVTEHVAVAGQTVDVNATLTKIDAPVHIVAPPSNQVETG